MTNYGICLKDCSVLNLNDPTSVIFLRAGELLKCFYNDDNNTVYRVFEYDKNKLKLCETLCSCHSSTIGIINDSIWNFLIAVKNVQNRVNLSMDTNLIDFIRNIKVNDVVLIKKEAFEDAQDDLLCTIQCITQSSDYPGHYFGVFPLKRSQQLPLIYTVSADYVKHVPEPIIDDDLLSVDSSEQEFEDGGISASSNQEAKIAYHKSLLDKFDVEDEFSEWIMKKRLNKPSTKPVIEIDSNNNDNAAMSVIVEKEVGVKEMIHHKEFSSRSIHEISQNAVSAREIHKEMERNLEKFNTMSPKKNNIPKLNPQSSLKEYKSSIGNCKEGEIDNKLKTFYETSMNEEGILSKNRLMTAKNSMANGCCSSKVLNGDRKAKDVVLLKNGHTEEMTANTGTIKKYVPPKTNFSFTKKRMSNTSDDQMNLNLQPAKIIKENGFSSHSSYEVPQNAVTAREINKEMERNLEKFKTISTNKPIEVYENGIEDHSAIVKPEISLKEYNSELEIKNKFKTFFDNSMMLGDYKSEIENSQLNEKCFADYKKVKENLISIDEFVMNLKRYKEENLNEIPRILKVPKTLASINAAIFHEKPNKVLDLPLNQLKISSAYALNKEESERIQKNLPLFYNLLFKNDTKDEKIIDEQKEQSSSYTGTIKKSLQLKSDSPNNHLPEQDFWNYNSIKSEPPAVVSSKHWTCLFCTFINDIKNDSCEMCNNSKSDEKHKNEIPISLNEMTKEELFPEVSSKWICSFCTFENELNNKICELCDNEKSLKESKSTVELISTLMNDENGLQHNKTRAICSICTNFIRSGRGVILRDCLHTFCFQCIHKKIVANIEPIIICPHEHEYKCSMPIQDREIKSIIGDELYEQYLQKIIENYQQRVKAVYCKSYKCKGWWEPNPARYGKYSICPICRAINCSVCNEIHGDMFCPKTVSKWETVAAKKITPIANPSNKVYKKDEVSRCTHPFQCPVCHKIIEPKKGILMQCNHACCENCLIGKIKKSCDKHIICPTQKKNRICKGFLNEQAIKSLLTIEEFKKYVNRRDTWFKCKNADCGLAFAKDKKVSKMNCPFCRAKNCFKCNMAHENNCFENK